MGVALVASAAKGMAGKLCATRLLAVICAIAVVVAYYWPKAYTFPCLIVFGGIVTYVHGRFIAKTEAPKYAVSVWGACCVCHGPHRCATKRLLCGCVWLRLAHAHVDVQAGLPFMFTWWACC